MFLNPCFRAFLIGTSPSAGDFSAAQEESFSVAALGGGPAAELFAAVATWLKWNPWMLGEDVEL